MARVDFQPAWARVDGADNGPPDNYNDYGDFLYEMASRYRGRIRAYEIWNEPNLAREWGGQPPDARQYVERQFEGDDILFASRTALDDGLDDAQNAHDANCLNSHRIQAARRLADG
jgi:hypothetical protein